MDTELLDIMQCQSCHTGFRLADVLVGAGEQVDFGIACCDCSEYPIVAGILHLDVGTVGRQLLSFLRQGKPDAAFALAMLGGSLTGPVLCAFLSGVKAVPRIGERAYGAFSRGLAMIGRRLRKRYDSRSFCEIVGRGAYAKYLKNRFSLDNFWLLLPCLPALRQSKGIVLDLCCGAGHASFIISQTVEPERLISADHTFRSLYLAKKYMTPQGSHICLDAGAPLPFRNGVLSSVLVMDAMHYIPARQLLASEIERLLAPRGMLFLLHLHNALSTNVWHQGAFALSPAQWAKLFQSLDCSVIPEEQVLKTFLYGNQDSVDSSAAGSGERAETSEELCLLGGRAREPRLNAKEAWELYRGLSSQLMINPLYEVRCEDGGITLIRLPVDEAFENRYRTTDAYLPEMVAVPEVLAPFVDQGTRQLRIASTDQTIWKAVSDLMRHFVVIPVPPHYGR